MAPKGPDFPRLEADRTFRGSAAVQIADVVREADHVDEEYQRDSDHRDAFVDGPADRLAADSLDQREGDVAAVERQQRQQVQEREREADQGQDGQVVAVALVHRLARGAHDSHRRRDLLAVRGRGDVHDPAAHRLGDVADVVAGPAEITATFFQVRWRQYESGPSASLSSSSPRRAARAAPGESFASAVACSSSWSAARAPSKSPSASGRLTRTTAGSSRGSS